MGGARGRVGIDHDDALAPSARSLEERILRQNMAPEKDHRIIAIINRLLNKALICLLTGPSCEPDASKTQLFRRGWECSVNQ
jgi:hypothetical protein